MLATLGLIFAVHPAQSEKAAQWGEQLIVIGLPVLFLLALPVGLVPAGLRAVVGLVVAAREAWGRAAVPGHRWLVITVLALLLSLVPLTVYAEHQKDLLSKDH